MHHRQVSIVVPRFDRYYMNVQSYLESLPEPILSRLYQSPSSCVAIFRLLNPFAKSIVLFSVFNAAPLKLSDIDNIVKPAHRRLQIEAMQNLKRLHIIKEKFTAKTVAFNSVFTASLRTAFTAGDKNASFGVPVSNSAKQIEVTRKYATEKWENILHFMVGNPTKPSRNALSLLQSSGLMLGPSHLNLAISSSGFQFLLQDQHTQVWSLLLHYLNQCTQLDMDPVDVLNFIFMLGSLELGTAYALNDLSSTQTRLLQDLDALGLIYREGDQDGEFYPTQLATMLTSEAKQTENREKGFIIVETNYCVYAYTNNILAISILSLFCNLRSKFSNLVVGRITRESIREALKKGISAAQIIEYMSSNAHEQMLQAKVGEHILPPTVSDQIMLWQLEMDRLRATSGYLYRDFTTAKEYNLIVSYASEMGALVWKNDSKRIFFVTKENNGQVLDYINRKMH